MINMDVTFLRMLRKKYNIDDLSKPVKKKSIFEQLEDCDKIDKTNKKVVEAAQCNCASDNYDEALEPESIKNKLCAKWGCSEEAFDDMISHGILHDIKDDTLI